MPSVEKQNPKQVVRPQNNGSILSGAIPVEQVENRFINMVLYGINRVGKTTLACQFPKPLLLISFEPGTSGGSASVRKVQGVHFVRITKKADAIALARELRTDKVYKTHVLDTCTSLQDSILQELMGLEDAPAVQLNWGTVPEDYYRERSEQAKEVMRFFRDLPAHTVFVAQEKDHNPVKEERNRLVRGPRLESFFAADLGSATVKWMHDACDYVGRLYLAPEVKETVVERVVNGVKKQFKNQVETGKWVRRLQTMFTPPFFAGFRSATPGMVPEFIHEPTFEKILKVINGEKL